MNKYLRSPKAAIVLFALAAVLLLFGGVNAIQAAPRIESSDYRAQVQLSNINVALTENGTVMATEDELFGDLLARSGDTQFKIGKKYADELSVRNTRRPDSTNEGDGIEEYVRVTVYTYWTDDNGKNVNLDPSLIKLSYLPQNGWVIDEEASTPERTVLYYQDVVPPERDTKPFADGIAIDGAVVNAVQGGEFKYEDVNFNVKITADAVQTHNGTEAMKSAWGRTNTDE